MTPHDAFWTKITCTSHFPLSLDHLRRILIAVINHAHNSSSKEGSSAPITARLKLWGVNSGLGGRCTALNFIISIFCQNHITVLCSIYSSQRLRHLITGIRVPDTVRAVNVLCLIKIDLICATFTSLLNHNTS